MLKLPPRIAIIGISGYGGSHLRVLSTLARESCLKIACATVINRPEVEESCQALEADGCRIYDNYTEMFQREAGNIDLCVIPTGIAWHHPMTLAALKAGCHVLVEKPAAGTVEQVDEMIAAREAAGRRVFVGFHDLLLDRTVELKQSLISGIIGEVHDIRVMGCWPRTLNYYRRNSWAGCLRSGDHWVYDSPANNALAHYLMAALYFAADRLHAVARVESFEAELYRAQAIESFDTLSMRLQTDSNILIFYSVTHSACETINPVVEVVGSSGTIRWEVDQRILCSSTGQETPALGGSAMRQEMYHNILAALANEQPAGCTLEMAREHTSLINELHAHCPIHEVSAQYLVEGTGPKGHQVAIRGIEANMQQAFAEGKLFSELELPWAARNPVTHA